MGRNSKRMMEKFKPINEVPNVYLCKKLKKLGYPQGGGGWYWVKENKNKSFHLTFMTHLLQEMSPFVEEIKAPTVPELGKWLPKDTFIHKSVSDEDLWICEWEDTKNFASFPTGNLADCFAKMLIWLIENGYASFSASDESKRSSS